MQNQIGIIDVPILINMINPLCIKKRGTTFNIKHDIAELIQVRAVLASDAGEEYDFSRGFHNKIIDVLCRWN